MKLDMAVFLVISNLKFVSIIINNLASTSEKTLCFTIADGEPLLLY
jgi:hypothetical protein